MPFGALLSNETALFTERHIRGTWSGLTIGQGQTGTLGLASMVMPFTGDILVDVYLQLSYPGPASILAAEVWPSSQMMAATNSFVGKVCNWDVNGGSLVCPMFGRWANLAKGTNFQLTVDVKAPIVNGTCSLDSFEGFMRAQAY